MRVVKSLDDCPPVTPPVALTIGLFDGIHIGHQALISRLHKIARKKGTKAVLTFANHPSSILNPDRPTPLISSFSHRLHLLEKYGIDLTIALFFTHELANQSYETFLTHLYDSFPFDGLVLGEGASFGNNKQGDTSHLEALSEKMHFKIHCVKKEKQGKQIISSRFIRTLIEKRKLQKIKKFLGRPYSIWKHFDFPLLKKEDVSLYSYSFEETGLCSLPCGVYAVDFRVDEGVSLPSFAFVRSVERFTHSILSITFYLSKKPAEGNFFNLSFIEYLHPEIDMTSLRPKSSLILENFSAKPSLS